MVNYHYFTLKGEDNNMPVGITFVRRAWSESVLIEIACLYEQATRYRKAPQYLLTD